MIANKNNPLSAITNDEQRHNLLERIVNNTSECSNPLLVVGMPRSGSSMMGLALSLPVDVCYLEESLAVQPLTYMKCSLLPGLRLATGVGNLFGGEESFPRAKLREVRNRLKKIDLLSEVVTRGLLHAKVEKTYDLRPKNPLHEVTGVSLDDDEKALINRLMHKYRRKLLTAPQRFPQIFFEDCRLLSGRDRVLEKTPTNVLSIPLLRKLFPSARIVFIHRQDKRAVVASWVHMAMKAHGYKQQIKDRVTENAAKYMAGYFDKASSIFAEERIRKSSDTLCVTYEEIIESPSGMMEKIYDFSQLELTPQIALHWNEIGATKSGFEALEPELQRMVTSVV